MFLQNNEADDGSLSQLSDWLHRQYPLEQPSAAQFLYISGLLRTISFLFVVKIQRVAMRNN
jgi:hypothetical protein